MDGAPLEHHGVPEAELIRYTDSRMGGDKPFGWTFNKDREAIRAELIAGGADPDSIETHFAVIREHDRRRAQELTYRQRIDLARWLGLKWVTPHPSDIKRRETFTDEELAAIMERFSMANDELGAGIAAKALRMLPTPPATHPEGDE